MKIWVDDVRPAPSSDFLAAKTVYEVIDDISLAIETGVVIELIDLDHDAGDYAYYGGDYIRILDWLEEQELSFPIHIHSMNPVGVQNMRNIIQRNNWTEV